MTAVSIEDRKRAFPGYEARAAVIDKIRLQLQSDWLAGMAQVHEYALYESGELKRDLYAMLWEQRLLRNLPMERQQLSAALLSAATGASPFIQGQALKFLLDFRADDFSEDNRHVIESFSWGGPYADLQIRLAGVAQVKTLIPKLKEVVGVQWRQVGTKRYKGTQWAAALALARMAQPGYDELVINAVNHEQDPDLRCALMEDLAFTKQPRAFDALKKLLRSNSRAPSTDPSMKSPPESWFAAVAMARNLADFPMKSSEVDEASIPGIQKWADRVPHWQITGL